MAWLKDAQRWSGSSSNIRHIAGLKTLQYLLPQPLHIAQPKTLLSRQCRYTPEHIQAARIQIAHPRTLYKFSAARRLRSVFGQRSINARSIYTNHTEQVKEATYKFANLHDPVCLKKSSEFFFPSEMQSSCKRPP
jgi:hypothetical protein